MRVPPGFYQMQIELCGQRAAAAGLANERAMFLRSQAAWQELADAELRASAERTRRLTA